jgi:hypothetical protein
LLKGNHDASDKANEFQFYAEIDAKYGKESGIKQKIEKIFDLFPLAVFIGSDNTYIACCHGILPYLKDTAFEAFKHDLTTCIVSQSAQNCTAVTSTQQALLIGRLLLDGEIPDNSDPYVNITDLTPAYLKSLSSEKCTIMAVFCGHKHFYPPVSVANGNKTEWVALLGPAKVMDHTVFIFTSAPEALGGKYHKETKQASLKKPSEGGFGVLRLHKSPGEWTVTPYADKTTIMPQERKFVHVAVSGGKISFSYQDAPQEKNELEKI